MKKIKMGFELFKGLIVTVSNEMALICRFRLNFQSFSCHFEFEILTVKINLNLKF